MARIKTVEPGTTSGIRGVMLKFMKKQYDGFLPGIMKIVLVDLKIGKPSGDLYKYLHLRKKSPLTRLQREMTATVVNGIIGGAPWLGLHTAAVRRLTGNEHLTPEFATTWPTFDLDDKTRALLTYAKKLTESPGMIDDSDIDNMRTAGWDDDGVYEATALISYFNYTGRMEAASGLPPDEVPDDASFAEATPDNR